MSVESNTNINPIQPQPENAAANVIYEDTASQLAQTAAIEANPENENDPGITQTVQNDTEQSAANLLHVGEAGEIEGELAKISSKEWQSVVDWVLTVPHLAPFRLVKKFGFDERMSWSVFEELQARGIVTKLYIPMPGGAIKGDNYDVTRFGGYMVLAKPDGSSKDPNPPAPIEGGPHYTPAGEVRVSGRKARFLGRGMLRKAVETAGQASADYVNLKTFQAADSADFLTGGRRKREHDHHTHGNDRLYAEIFNPRLGEVNERGRTIVTSWMDPSESPWERTAPQLVVVELNPSEQEAEDAIIALRQEGKTNDEIRDILLRRYHPDLDGGDVDKFKYVSDRLRIKRVREEDEEDGQDDSIDDNPRDDEIQQPTPPILPEQPQRPRRDPEDDRQPQRPTQDPFDFALEYVASIDHKDPSDETYTMAEESLLGAFIRRGMSSLAALKAYKDLQEHGVVDGNGVVNKARARSLANTLRQNRA